MLKRHAAHLLRLKISNPLFTRDIPNLPALRMLTVDALSDRLRTHCPSLTSLRVREGDDLSPDQVEQLLQGGAPNVLQHLSCIVGPFPLMQSATMHRLDEDPRILVDDAGPTCSMPPGYYGRLVTASLAYTAEGCWKILPHLRAVKTLSLWAAGVPRGAPALHLPHLKHLVISEHDSRVDLGPLVDVMLRSAPRLTRVELCCRGGVNLAPALRILELVGVQIECTNSDAVRAADWPWIRVKVQRQNEEDPADALWQW